MDLKLIKPDMTLDVLGMLCPIPVTKTAEAIRKLACGQVLEIISDDAVILVDMPAWCIGHSEEYLGHTNGERNGQFRVFVRKQSS